MQHTPMRRVPPPGCSDEIHDMMAMSPSYVTVWMAMQRYAIQMPAHMRTPWLNSVVRSGDAISLFAILRQRPEALDLLMPIIEARATHLQSCPVWMHLVGEPTNTAHGRLALLARAQAFDTDAWQRLLAFAHPRMHPRHIHSGVHREWVTFLNMPNPAHARTARKQERQRLRGRTPGPVGGDAKRRPHPIS